MYDIVCIMSFSLLLFQRIILSGTVKSEMAHQLYIYQALILNLHSNRMMAKVDSSDPVNIHCLFSLVCLFSS